MIPEEWLQAASERIRGLIFQTPLTYDDALKLHLKWENRQITRSFKARGALNKILSLESWEIQNGLVTCSAGNHGQGVALAANHIGAKSIIFISSHAVQTKVDAMKSLGAEIRTVEGGYEEAEKAAIEYASVSGAVFISPYNDVQVIAGQATVGMELLEQSNDAEEIDTILVPVGGGGLISGIGAVLARLPHKPKLIGVQSMASAYMRSIFYDNSQDGVIETESLADGLAGKVDTDSITIPMVRHYVDEIMLVEESSIECAVAYAWKKYNEVIEGSAAVTLAAVLDGKVKGKRSAVIISGGNIQPEIHRKLIARYY